MRNANAPNFKSVSIYVGIVLLIVLLSFLFISPKKHFPDRLLSLSGLSATEKRNASASLSVFNTSTSSAVATCSPPLLSIQRRTGSQKWVISYGLYGGENPRYIAAIKKTVSVHSKVLFPEWTVRIYYDSSISEATRGYLIAHGAELIPGPDNVRNKMVWRFLSATDPEVERFISRDADSFLTLREKWAVDEWVKSGKKFHNMRDHPSGGQYTMMGGMWGAVRGAVPGLDPILRGERKQNYMVDMDIINKHVWPLLKQDSLQHDAFTCNSPRFHANKPFPYRRIGWEIVGGVVIDAETGVTRPGDIDLIAKATPPAACVPPLKALVMVSEIDKHARVETQCVWELYQGTPSACTVKLVRLNDVFADWDWGSGYGVLFDQETAFFSYPFREPPLSLFERNSTNLLERVKYFPRLAHVLLPHTDSSWKSAVLPRLQLLLSQLNSSIPILLARSELAETALNFLNSTGQFDISRVIWHAGKGHMYYAQEMWFLVSSCSVSR